MKLIVPFLFIISLPEAHGQLFHSDAKSFALAGSVVAMPGIHGLFFNPATIYEEESPVYLLTGGLPVTGIPLKSLAAGACWPLRGFIVGGSAEFLGDDLYQQSRVTLSAARSFGAFSTGLGISWNQQAFEGEGAMSLFTIDAGTVWILSENVNLGFHFRKKVSGNGSGLVEHSLLETAIYWKAASLFSMNLQWKQRLSMTSELTGSFIYQTGKRISLYLGWRVKPIRVHGGVGFELTNLSMDYALALDPVLGTIHSVTLKFDKSSR